jgi:BlaR1 peptidase M56/Gram-negative bacterial TonB protein C-terminal
MTAFLLTSGIAMAVLLAVYHLLLQREKMHRFNRFFLLGAIVVSLILPFIKIPIYVKAAAIAHETINPQEILLKATPPVESIIYWPYVLWGVYGLVTLLFTIRFALNIYRFYSVKKQSNTLPYKGATVVLLDDAVAPHTFFSSIFVSHEDYNNRHAKPELFTHELAHVNQRHTLDILFIEALKTLMWFNPLIYFYKRAIQLNHEFLADAATLKQHYNVTNYQSLLLGKAQPSLQFALASSINFSITKKRFLMMTKTTTKGKATMLKLAALPVLAGLVYALSTKTVAQQMHQLPEKPLAAGDYYQEYTLKTNIAKELTKGAATAQEDTQPEYPGGYKALYKVIMDNVTIPADYKGSTKIIISFVVEKDGTVSDIKALKSENAALSEQVIKAFDKSEKWQAGTKNGKPVNVEQILPVVINAE